MRLDFAVIGFWSVCASLVAGCTATPETVEATQPARVAVAFDRASISPVVVEGIADRSTGREVEANDPVRIASISKLVMAIAALRLADEGVVDIDEDVSTYLGWQVRAPGFPDDPITIRQLLSHRSGLRDDAGYVISLGESLRDRLAEPDAWYKDLPPGEAPFRYANLGSPLLASVLEAASGERYDALVERTVFAPLDIDACLNWIGCSDDQVAQAVVLYRDTGEVARDDAADLPPNCTIPVVDGRDCDLSAYQPGENASVFSPQGGVRIGMMDLAKLGQALVAGSGDLLMPDTVNLMLTSASDSVPDQEFFCGYGFGIQKIETPGRECQDDLFVDGTPRWGHAGEAYGLRSGLWIDPETGEGLAYFITAVPPRASAEDEGGFDPQEIALVARVMEALAN